MLLDIKDKLLQIKGCKNSAAETGNCDTIVPNTRCPDTRVEPLVKASLVNSVKNVPVVGELEIYENKRNTHID